MAKSNNGSAVYHGAIVHRPAYERKNGLRPLGRGEVRRR